jgi:hypothetical protein
VLMIKNMSGTLILGLNDLYWEIITPVKKSDTALMSDE